MITLNESRRDDLLLPYVEILKSKGINCTTGILKKWLLRHLTERGGLRNLSLSSNFYLAGAAKYYFNGDLTNNKNLAIFDETNSTTDIWKEDICERLNALILILRNGVIDSVGETFEQPEDFGELPIAKLLRKYGTKINKELGIDTKKKKKSDDEVKELDKNPNFGNDYTFDIIYSYQEARKYNKYTKPGAWCITYGEQYYNSYVRNLGIHYVILRKNGWENVPRVKGPEWTKKKPQDEYGCSLIALLQSNKNGEPVYITSRWNHGHDSDNSDCNADHAFTKEELFQKTGMTDADLQRIFKIWKNEYKLFNDNSKIKEEEKKEKLRILRYFKYAQMRINGGENPDSVLINIPSNIQPQNIEEYKEASKIVLVGNGKPLKSIIIYRVDNVENDIFYVLVDKGKILFDTITPKGRYRPSNWWNSTFEYSDGEHTHFKWLNNAIVIRIPGDKYMIYDIRQKNYVTIDGVNKFKYLENQRFTHYSENSLFYEIRMTNRQIALVNCKTNLPLQLPNGEYWFEQITIEDLSNNYGRRVEPRIIKETDNIFTIIYDSSARIVFFYDPVIKQFIDIDTSDFRDVESINATKLNYPTIGEILIVRNESWEWAKKDCYIYKNNEKMSIGNITNLGGLKITPDIFSFVPENKIKGIMGCSPTNIFWLPEEQSFLFNDDNTIFFGTNDNFYKGCNNNFWFIRTTRLNDARVRYSAENFMYKIYCRDKKAFLINPYDNSEIFKCNTMKSLNYEGESVTICKTVDEESYYGSTENIATYNYDYLLNNGFYRIAVKPNTAPLKKAIEESDENETSDTILENITLEDIKHMVNETLNRLKNYK